MSDNRILELLKNAKVEWKPLQDVSVMKRGKSITAKDVTGDTIPVISGGKKPAYYTGDFNCSGETIVIAGSGAYAGYVTYWNEPIYVGDSFSIKPSDDLLKTKYLYHVLLNKQSEIYLMKKGVGIPHVYPKDLSKFSIPIPPLEI